MRILALLLVMGLLSGCAEEELELERGMELRSKILKAEYVEFDVDITADYGDKLHSFSMTCRGDSDGTVHFTVTAPETIAGITGKVSGDEGLLTFDEIALSMDLLTDDQLSPIGAPWVFLKTLRSGYLRVAGQEGEQLRLTIQDSYEEDSLQLDIWIGDDNIPIQSEILYDGKRILSLNVRSFRIL